MKKSTIIQFAAMLLCICAVWSSCKKIEEPALGDYPKDTNAPGGPLKFYAAYDGTTTNPLFNAVDSIRANFASSNPLTAIDGISGKAVQGVEGKAIKYTSPNDFVKFISSYSISVWVKNGIPADDRYEVPFQLAHNDLYYKAAIHFDVYPGNGGSTAASANAYYYMEQPNGDYFEAYITGSDAIPNLLDNNWHHLVFTYDETNSTFKLYKDGAQVYSSVWTGHGPFVLNNAKVMGLAVGGSNRQAEIEASNDSWMYSWSGGVDQLRLYGKVLTAAEISALYSSRQ